MDKMILLMKDHSIIYTIHWKELLDSIEYILFKVNDQLDTFILQKPNDYLSLFTKIKISFEAVITQHNVDETVYNNFTSGFCKVDEEFTSINKMIQYLHSLNRIKYSNYIMNSNDSPIYEEIKFCYFRIDGFKENKRIFHYKNTANKERKFFGPKEVLMDIDKIYDPFMKGEKCFLSIDPIMKRWKLSEKMMRDSICGVPLEESSSFVFYDPGFIKFIDDNIKGVYCQTWIYDHTKFDNGIVDELHQLHDDSAYEVENGAREYFQSVRLLDYWAVSVFMLFEFITYLPYLYIIIQTTKEVNDRGEFKDIYSSRSYIEIDLKNTPLFMELPDITCNDKNVVSMEDIFYLIGGDNNE